MSEKLRLKVTTGAAEGKEMTVDDELVLGREAPGEGMIPGDVEISRQHARIVRGSPTEWRIEDLGSRNGTFVNGHRIDGNELLGAGDAIEVGGTRLVVQVSSPATAETEPEPEPAPLKDTRVGDVPPAAPDPAPLEPEPAPLEPLPPVSLTVDLDPSAGEATISLGPGSDRIRLVFEDGAWRLRSDS